MIVVHADARIMQAEDGSFDFVKARDGMRTSEYGSKYESPVIVPFGRTTK